MADTERSPQSELRLGALLGLTTGILSAVVSSLLLLVLAPPLQSRLQDPTCDDPRGLDLVRPTTAMSSTGFLAPQGAYTYEEENLLDGDTGTAWVEGVTSADAQFGEGTTLTFDFDEDLDLQLLCLVNGYGESFDSYIANARLRLVDVETDQGDKDDVGLPEKTQDTFATYQSLSVETGDTDQVRLTIRASRAGQGADRAADLAISEIEFWSAD